MAFTQSAPFFSHLSIRKKIFLMVGLTQLFAIVSIAIGIGGMFLSNHSLRTIHTNSLAPLQNLRSCKNTIEKGILQTATDLSEGSSDFDSAARSIRQSHQKLTESWKTYLKGSMTPEEAKKLSEVKMTMERVERSVILLEKAVESRQVMSVLDLLQSDFPYTLTPASEQLDALIQLQISNADTLYVDAQEKFNQTLLLIALSLPVGMGIVLFVLRLISKDLLTKISHLTRIAGHLRSGDLVQRVECSGTDELATATRDMNDSMEELQKMLQSIAWASSNSIASAQEVNRVSQAINRRIETSSSDISQTHSQIGTLRDIVQQSASSAEETRKKIDEATTNLTHASDQISRMNDDIQTVADTQQHLSQELKTLTSQAQQVRGVLDIIGDIADQTNLLALNAAIEAARAGEHGRGFAVVADEVRKLAERTQESLSQINQTIRTIVNAITDTSQKMEKSAHSVLMVSQDSNEVHTIIRSSSSLMSTAAQSVHRSNKNLSELMEGMVVISGRIDSLNQNASSNAASVREIADVAIELNESTADLSEKLKKFRI